MAANRQSRGRHALLLTRPAFDLAIIPFRPFLHLMTSADHRMALGNIRDQLAEEGHLVFNIFDPRLDMIASHLGQLLPAPREGGRVHPSEDGTPSGGMGESPLPTRRNQTIEEEPLFDPCDALWAESTAYGMEHLLELSGFAVEALYGGFDRGPFHHGREQVWVARGRHVPCP